MGGLVWCLTLSLPRLSKNQYLTAKHTFILLFFIDLLVNLVIILFLDICAYHLSLKRAFYTVKSDVQYVYLPLKLSPTDNPGHIGIPVKRLQSSVAVNGKNDYSRRRQ